MPELPEVETVRRGLAPAMDGAVIGKVELRRPDLRFPFSPDFAGRITAKRIAAIGRRSKYLLLDIVDGPIVIMHLGMSGSFRVENSRDQSMPGAFAHERSRIAAHDHVIFHLTTETGDAAKIIYNDPRRFGFMLLCERNEIDTHPQLAKLGVEPVGNEFDGDYLAKNFSGRSAPLKSVLLDQSIIAGLGNIYVCEALWRSKLSPKRMAATLVRATGRPTRRLELLVENIRAVIAEAIAAGGSTLRDHALTDGSLGYFQHSFAVYGREGEPCPNECGEKIKRLVQSGRSTFYCSKCQR